MHFAKPLENSHNAHHSTPSSRWKLNQTWLTWLVAFSALMFIQLSQTTSVIVFMVAVAICAFARPQDAWKAILESRFVWPFLLYAAFSIIWSQASDLTARGVVELTFTVVAATLVAQTISPKAFVSAIVACCLVATVASIIYLGPELIAEWNSGFPVQGIFLGSKNSFGAAEALFILAGFYFALDRTRPYAMRILMIPCIFLAVALLISSRSATAALTVVPALLCSAAMYLLVNFSPRFRPIILFSVCAISVLFTAMIIPVVESTLPLFLDASGKDVTLTGRTLLWRWADRIIADNPILGFGYEAFWIPGNSYAELIWLEQGMAWRSGLHFHSQWYEVAVELGLIGLVLAVIVFMIVFVSVFSWALRRPSPESCFFLGFLIFTTIRTYVEVDLFWQYSLAFMIFIASYCYAKREKRERAALPSTAVEFV